MKQIHDLEIDESIISVFNILFESVLFRFDFVLFNIISFWVNSVFHPCNIGHFRFLPL